MSTRVPPGKVTQVTFLDVSHNMRETTFTDADTVRAQRFLSDLLTEMNPDWLKTPTGPLASHWNNTSKYSAAYLTNLANVLNALNQLASIQSAHTLRGKLDELLQEENRPNAHEELLTELEAGRIIAENVTPLIFEPLENLVNSRTTDKAKSPDYGVLLNDGQLNLLEVTQVTFGFLNNWQKAVDAVIETIHRRIRKRKLNRSVEISASILTTRGEMEQLAGAAILDKIVRNPKVSKTSTSLAGVQT